MRPRGAFMQGASAPFDPAVLALTTWYRAGSTWSAAAGTWDGTASAGPSGDANRQLSTAGSKPTDSAALNGLSGPHFVAASAQVIASTRTLAQTISSTAYSGWVLGSSTSFPAGAADSGPAFINDSGRWWGVYTDNQGGSSVCSSFVFSGGRFQDDQVVVSGTPFLFQYYRDLANIYSRLNSGAWSAGTAVGAVGNLTGAIYVGLGGIYLSGDIWEIGVIDTSLFASPAAADDIVSYVNARYGTSF